MDQSLIFIPVLAQVSLTIFIFLILAARKAKAVNDGFEDRSKAALNNKAWPEHVVKASNSIDNQFQVPVLFYVVCLSLYQMGGVTTLALVFAGVFSVSRYFHAYVHLGSNFVPLRLRLFLVGSLCVIGLTVLAISKIMSN